MAELRVVVLRRLAAFAVDWLVMALYGGCLFAAVLWATGGAPGRPAGPWLAQGLGFLAMTLPVLAYFTWTEGSARSASPGKRLCGIVVVGEDHARLRWTRAGLRSAVKFAPWEVGHLVANQAIYAGDDGPPAWGWGAMVVALGTPLWWLACLWVTGRTPYDRWTKTLVLRHAPAGDFRAVP